MATVPDVTGVRLSKAFSVLLEAGLQPVLIGLPTIRSNGNVGYWIAVHEPVSGVEVEHGARVALAAAPRPASWGTLLGHPTASPDTPAPEVVGLELDEAMEAITNLALIVVVFQPERAVETLTIRRQQPDPGERVPFREVAIWLD